LSDDLAEIFHEESVFMDVNAIQPGRDFRKAIDESIHKCSVLLAILGQGWLDSKDGLGRRRLDDETDFVRLEIASALQRDIPVVPVLVRGAKMPRAEQLPEDLRELAFRNAVELTHARWKSDVQLLIRALGPYLKGVSPEADVSASPSKSSATAVIQKAVVESTAGGVATGLEKDALAAVSHKLAAYIGPIAEVVVKRAARRCTSLIDLCDSVAQEIEGSADRAKFLASCRH
jgi:hypothetical protein